MHCASCEVLVERRLRKIPGVEKATVSLATGTAIIEGTREVSHKELKKAIDRDGYKITTKNNSGGNELTLRDYGQIGAIFLIIFAAYSLFKYFDILPDIGVSDGMGLGLVFVIGLIAATSSCLAVTGGLLLALAARQSEQNPGLSGSQKFRPTIYFNAGRLLGYILFGAALGAIGSLLTFSTFSSGIVTMLSAIIMLVLGLQMLRVIPFLNKFSLSAPKFIAHKLCENSTGAYKPWAPFILGAGTFFLPCGFTQALQFYVLAQGSALVGATTMGVFALGTLPVLLAISAISSFSAGSLQKHFIRIAAVLIIILGLISFPAGYTLVTLGGDSSAPVSLPTKTNIELMEGVQVARMTVEGLVYAPSEFTVVQGVPVRWEIKGLKAQGCGQIILAPAVGIKEPIGELETTIVEFTPTKLGTIPFSCSMGMTTPGARFNVVAG